jgi:zinc transport system substrate-binding protein
VIKQSLLSISRPSCICLIAVLAGFFVTPAVSKELRVVTSLKPLHSLVSAIMAGTGKPEFLLKALVSPHDARLRPSQARAIARADLIVWIGGQMESSLAPTIKNLGADRAVITVLNLPDLNKLPARASGVWDQGSHGHSQGHDNYDTDPHAWLTTGNAAVIAKAVAVELARLNPSQAMTYETNLESLRSNLDILTKDLKALLLPVHKIRYVALHDAFQYFEHQFGLSPVGALSPTSGTTPGAKRIHELRAQILRHNVRCIASDPFSATAYIKTLGASNSQIVLMDPEGLDIPAGPDHYSKMMRQNASTLASCLSMR